MYLLEIVLLIWNSVVFILYGLDKLYAKSGRRRISEAALLLSCLFAGGMGAMFGMVLFNHKTSKPKFRFLVPLLLLLQLVLLYGWSRGMIG